MNAADRKIFVKKAFLFIWAMFTLALITCLLLLLFEMIQQGKEVIPSKNPLTGATPKTPVKPAEPGAKTSVTVYFGSLDGRILIPQTAQLEQGNSTVENCRRMMQLLIQGPQTSLTPILPLSVQVRGVFLLSTGELVLDLSHGLRDIMGNHTSSMSTEALMVYGIVNSLTQEVLHVGDEPAVQSVRFLLEGSPLPNGSFPEHFDLSEPIQPDSHWIMQQEPAPVSPQPIAAPAAPSPQPPAAPPAATPPAEQPAARDSQPASAEKSASPSTTESPKSSTPATSRKKAHAH